MTIRPWKRISSRIFSKTPYFQVREEIVDSPIGKRAQWYLFDFSSWVNIIALKDDNVILIKQYRHGSQSISIEIPGGNVDEGELPLHAAQRELKEETGYVSSNWTEIGNLNPNPAIQANRCFTFLALDVEDTGETAFDPNEEIENFLHPLKNIDPMIGNGEIDHALVVAAFDHLRRYQNPNPE